MLQNRLPGALHVRRVGTVAGELERVVGLDAAADVESTAVVERPAAVLRLMRAQIARQLRLQRRVDLIEEMHHQDELGRNGAIGFELERPMPVGICRSSSASRAA